MKNQNKPIASIIIATQNRNQHLKRLLSDLCHQSEDKKNYEIILVYDGGDEKPDAEIKKLANCVNIKIIKQQKKGQSHARQKAVENSTGNILITLDDDMRVGSSFIHEHISKHKNNRIVVLGNIEKPSNKNLPAHEKFHLETIKKRNENQEHKINGSSLCTGNSSFSRNLFFKAGGFDVSLLRSEDKELGIRLEENGAIFIKNPKASSRHDSPHNNRKEWLNKAYKYGVYDQIISTKHKEKHNSSTSYFKNNMSPIKSKAVSIIEKSNIASKLLSNIASIAAESSNRITDNKLPTELAKLAFAIQYHNGAFNQKKATHSTKNEAIKLYKNIMEDRSESVKRRMKYHIDPKIEKASIELITKTGFQICTLIRIMQFMRNTGHKRSAKATSRFIRHMYGSDIHWNCDIEPGISIIHGIGIVISESAKISSGTLVSHNVTIGKGLDQKNKKIGAPKIHKNVHISPNCTITGPIIIGENTKIAPGCTVSQSTPKNARVFPNKPKITTKCTTKTTSTSKKTTING